MPTCLSIFQKDTVISIEKRQLVRNFGEFYVRKYQHYRHFNFRHLMWTKLISSSKKPYSSKSIQLTCLWIEMWVPLTSDCFSCIHFSCGYCYIWMCLLLWHAFWCVYIVFDYLRASTSMYSPDDGVMFVYRNVDYSIELWILLTEFVLLFLM